VAGPRRHDMDGVEVRRCASDRRRQGGWRVTVEMMRAWATGDGGGADEGRAGSGDDDREAWRGPPPTTRLLTKRNSSTIYKHIKYRDRGRNPAPRHGLFFLTPFQT
jgi:hypothetical protein